MSPRVHNKFVPFVQCAGKYAAGILNVAVDVTMAMVSAIMLLYTPGKRPDTNIGSGRCCGVKYAAAFLENISA